MQNPSQSKSQRKPLSSRSISTMKPTDGVKADTGENAGLRVRCGKTGVKTFFYRYRSPITDKLVQMRLGHFPQLSLAEARSRLQDLKQVRQQGRCPATEERLEKEIAEEARLAKEQGGFTVEAMVELYLTEYIEDRMINGKRVRGARTSKGQDEVRRTLHNDPIRVLGSRQAEEITRKDVSDLVLEIVNRGANVQAGSVLRELSAAFEYAIGMDRFNEGFTNPCLSAKASLKRLGIRLTHQRGRRYLSDEEIKAFLKWLPGSAFTPTQKNILRFTLWTGCRSGEVCNAEWKDIDLEKATWHLKTTKTGVERTVQLPRQAVEFLQQLKLTTGDFPFPSQKTGLPILQKALTEQAWRLRVTNRMLDIAPWSPHDLRRTVRTGLSRLRCPSEVAEAILGHSRKGIEGTYDLHKYEEECREWLQRWADYLEGVVGG